MTKIIEKWLAIILLVGSIGFNIWLYRAEPTAKIDPNDNAFQYALIDRTNTIWNYADRTCAKNVAFSICHLALLTDHWVPNWEEGYNLPYYYSHVPQILIVGSYRVFQPLFHTITLFQYYHEIIYLLLCFLPLSIFLAFCIIGMPPLTAGIAAVLATQVSTDGLYGIDPSSFLWRGWGLSSQLFALIWFPLAIASCIRFISEKNKSKTQILYGLLTVFFLVCTTTGHLGIGMMAFMSVGIMCCSPAFLSILKQKKIKEIGTTLGIGIKQTLILCIPVFIVLSYWILPTVTQGIYHNISVWDPVWKFNSFGVIEVMTKLVNGDLFDFGRFPLYTLLIFIGIFVCFLDTKSTDNKTRAYTVFPFLFLFFICIFFGATTWGNLMNLIPGMADFHQHRFIVGLHLAGIFLAPIGLVWMIRMVLSVLSHITKHASKTLVTVIPILMYVIIVGCTGYILFPQTIRYATYNDTLIQQANIQFDQQKPDIDLLVTTLQVLEQTHPRHGGTGFQSCRNISILYVSFNIWHPNRFMVTGNMVAQCGHRTIF